MKIAIVGTGYVGLVTGTCFAEMGNEVICVDIDQSKVDLLKSGKLPIYEPGLVVFLERNQREERINFTTSLKDAIEQSDVIFLALPTPANEDGSADLSYVLHVAKEMTSLINGYKVVVNKSTVPIGTADKVRAVFESAGLRVGQDFDVVSNPEFLREGVAVKDFMKPDRVVIGASNERAAKMMRQLYEPFVHGGNPILIMDERSAEMTKYAANAFLATKITFMNEIANLCERTGANVDLVRRGIGSDVRIGKEFLYAGMGFGGSCFPKDVKALSHTAEIYGYDFKILKSVLTVNAQQQVILFDPMHRYFKGNLQGKRIGIWGLAFKANTDDVREASSHALIRKLLETGAELTVFDPEAMENTRQVFGDSLIYAADRYSAINGADALAICTDWNEFRSPDFSRVKRLLKNHVIFDGRNLYDLDRMKQEQIVYVSVGRNFQAQII